MKINLKTVLLDELGDEVKWGDEIVTLGIAVNKTLLVNSDKVSSEQKQKRFAIWFDKTRNVDEADLASEEISEIKLAMWQFNGPLIAGQCALLLEGKEF